MKIVTIFLFIVSVTAVHGYNILVISHFPGPSHFLLFKTIMQGLLDRSHRVTCITNFPFKYDNKDFINYTEVLVDPPFDLDSVFPPRDSFTVQDMSVFAKLFKVMATGLITSRYAFESQQVQNFLQDETQKFDVVITEQFFQESFLMFAHKYNAPIVAVSSITYSDFMVQTLGFRGPYSFVPHYLLEYADDMSFFERATNTFVSIVDMAFRVLWYLPQQNQLAREFFSHLQTNGKQLPSVEELDNSKSLLLANTHLIFDQPRPSMPGMVNIGGLTLTKDLKKLPENIQNFIDGAEHGVIYFSWGTVMNPKDLPTYKMEMILKVFSKLNQRIIWKYDGYIENLPSNVLLHRWLPQKEILAHPNVKLFFSHGGIFGIHESVYYGVPMFITPFFGDQHKNAKQAQKSGYALYVYFKDITVEVLYDKFNELLTNRKYGERAKELSAIFQDSLVHPYNETMYWIEYVARHKGANHLKSHSRNLNIAQYYLWDVFAFAFISLGLGALATYQIFNRLLSKRKVKVVGKLAGTQKKRKIH